MLEARFVPIAQALPRPKGGYRRCPFKAGFRNTLETMERELDALRGKDLVVEADMDRNDIRNDGFPRSSARARTPGIRLSFTSRHGALVYACSTYPTWEENLRAIALTLERLRAVERYGASAGGEQYKGWAQLPPGAGVRFTAGEWGSVEDAARFILEVEGCEATDEDVEAVVIDPRGSFREAAKKAHPDTGGSPEVMSKLNRARDFIEAAQAVSA